MEPFTLKPLIEVAEIVSNAEWKNIPSPPTAFVGRYNIRNLYRILLKIPLNPLPQNAVILKSTLKLNILAFESDHLDTITCYALTEDWQVNTVTWSNQPSFNENVYSKTMSITNPEEYLLDITTIIQKWHDNEVLNFGLIVKNKELEDNVFSMLDTDTSSEQMVEIIYNLKTHCEVIPTKFIERMERLNTNSLYHFSKIRNTSLSKTITFFTKNLCEQIVIAKLQISPDGVNFIDDYGEIQIKMNETVPLIPIVFGKFTRVAVKTLCDGTASNLSIWYQCQE